MSITQTIRNVVQQKKPGTLLFFEEFLDPEQPQGLATAKALSRLHQEKRLERITKGIYYKPESSRFGPLPPSEQEVLQRLLQVQKVNLSYLTGNNIYTKMGLTTQLAREWVIATDKPRSALKIGPTRVRFIKSRVNKPVEDTRMLQILDAITDIQHIFAASIPQSCQTLSKMLAQFSPQERSAWTQLALAYPPRTRALAGLFLEHLKEIDLSQVLYQSLNPLTTFQLDLPPELSTKKHVWRFK